MMMIIMIIIRFFAACDKNWKSKEKEKQKGLPLPNPNPKIRRLIEPCFPVSGLQKGPGGFPLPALFIQIARSEFAEKVAMSG